VESIAEYGNLLRRDPDEWARLWPLALVAEGAFFRPAAQFEVARDLLSEWAIMAPERTLRVLSLGCGPGFETVSLAIALEETGLRAKNWQVEIYALDLNPEAVARAENAVFTAEDLEWLTEVQARKWFSPRSGGFHFKTDLAVPLHHEIGNAYEPDSWPFADLAGSFGLIFCRELSLEAPPAAARQLTRILRQVLAPSGFIFTAPGEFLPDSSGELILEERSGVTYYRRGVTRFKANRHHQPKKKRLERDRPEQDSIPVRPPLPVREQQLLAAAENELAAGRPEQARDLVGEVMLGALDRNLPAPEAWALIARIETALGRPDTARAAAEAALAS
jgi:chemotaxis methyl-accepting protein methylase